MTKTNHYFFQDFIKAETAGGFILIVAALLALIIANTPWQYFYYFIFDYPLQIVGNGKHIINDGLMTVFFLLVSLEIKHELLIGELNSRRKALLPLIAAIGGMLIPALIYFFINYSNKNILSGWAIPTATDIAFSLAILKLLGTRIAPALKTFLMALAIIDDLGAIIIIALFYTANISLLFLAAALVCIMILVLFNYFKVTHFLPYALIGIILWLCMLQSGVHATIAGVILGFTIPYSTARKVEHVLHPWIAYGVLPLFAFANAGLSFANLDNSAFFNPLTIGIAAGLFFGKPIGVMSACWLAIKKQWVELPKKMNWQQLFGVSLLCGIGFTMSLFIGTLAFANSETLNLVRLGVLSGSLLSAIAGYWILKNLRFS